MVPILYLLDISILILDHAYPTTKSIKLMELILSCLQIMVVHFQMLFEALCMLSRHCAQTIHHYLRISNRKGTLRSRSVSSMRIQWLCLHESIIIWKHC
jgi:hypothetical protein